MDETLTVDKQTEKKKTILSLILYGVLTLAS